MLVPSSSLLILTIGIGIGTDSVGLARADVVLSEHIMDLARTSAELSAAVCESPLVLFCYI